MTNKNIETAKKEALRFLERVGELELSNETSEMPTYSYYRGSKETGAVKRASMDLTRALAELRKPD